MKNTCPALQLENARKKYTDGRLAVADLSFNVYPGEVVAFLGPNGAGKTTTFGMITGLVRITSGKIRIFDAPAGSRPARRLMGAMIQEPAFYSAFSARRNLQLLARLRGPEALNDIEPCLQKVRLQDRIDDRVRTYSHGMKQRLGLAASLLGNPRLLLLDEPTNGMDPEAMHEVLSMVRKQAKEREIAVLLSSHLLGEVEEYCDRVIVINQGRLIAAQSVAEILRPRQHIFRLAFAGTAPTLETLRNWSEIKEVHPVPGDMLEIHLQEKDAAWLNEKLLHAGFRVEQLMPRCQTLRDFFLQQTGDNKEKPDNA